MPETAAKMAALPACGAPKAEDGKLF